MALLRNLRDRHPAAERPSRPVNTPREPASAPTIPVSVLKTVLDTEDRVTETPRGTSSGYAHLTDLIGLCPRYGQLAQAAHTPVHRSVTGGHRVMWAIGRAVEKHIRDTYIRSVNFKGVWGRWKCACERTVTDGLWQGHTCSFCGTPASNYHELPLADEEAGIIGSPDFVTLSARERLVITEIKSMTPEEWKTIEEPKITHRVQGSGYNRLYRINGFEVEPYVSVIYCTKLFRFGSPYKEFVYRVQSDAVAEAELDSMWETARIIKAGRGLAPRLPACSSHTTKAAAACPLVGECFMRGQ